MLLPDWLKNAKGRRSRRQARRKPAAKVRRQTHGGLHLEHLEDRRLLAVTASLDMGVLTVSLDAMNDHAFLQIDGSGNVDVGTTEGGEDVLANQTGVTSIVVEDDGANAGQQVTFSLGSAAFPQNVTLTGIETANLNQQIDGAVAGNATLINVDDPGQIQDGINLAAAGGTVNVAAGTYVEDVLVNKAGLNLLGAGPGASVISGPIGGDGATVRIAASNAVVAGFTITREGNNVADWNDPGLNLAGVAVQGQAVAGITVRDNLITGNRTGIDVNNSSGHTLRNNVIENNHTGLIFRNQTDNLTFVENAVIDNRTVGILFLDASGGTNSPVQSAANSVFFNNDISGNWYGQIVDRQAGGGGSAAGDNEPQKLQRQLVRDGCAGRHHGQ
jgi:parallel beta-helix repeat protein